MPKSIYLQVSSQNNVTIGVNAEMNTEIFVTVSTCYIEYKNNYKKYLTLFLYRIYCIQTTTRKQKEKHLMKVYVWNVEIDKGTGYHFVGTVTTGTNDKKIAKKKAFKSFIGSGLLYSDVKVYLQP